VRHPFRRKNARLRLLPVYLVAAVLFAVAEPTPLGFALGTALVAAGLALRAWSAGHLEKTRRLVMSGPYAHLRHPLYAGALLLGVGFGVMAGRVGLLIALAVGLPFFYSYYLPYKERVEGARLQRRYGEAYAFYRAGVPALLPALEAWTPPSELRDEVARPWNRECFRANRELGTLLGGLLALGLFAARLGVAP
jgi:protein-S-isoprenylcysteine O-methyltransferase Ste14